MAVFKDNWNGYEGKKWRVQIRYVDWQGKKREHNKRGLATKKEALEYEREFLAKKSRDINMVLFCTLNDASFFTLNSAASV